jgi:outer membrane biosynthesis protein TonB
MNIFAGNNVKHYMLRRSLRALVCLACAPLFATEYHGVVRFAGLPLPGATLTATRDDKKFVAATNIDGVYSFPNLPDGDYSIQIEMLCFTTVKKDVVIAPGVPAAEWEMKLLPANEIKAAAAAAAPTVSAPPTDAPVQTTSVPSAPAAPPPPANGKKKKGPNAPAPVNTASAFQRTDVNASAAPPPPSEAAQAAPSGDSNPNNSASDSLAINGSVNNGASSAFGLNQAFGNNRRGFGSLYNGNVSLLFDNSALDARNYSLTGQDTPKAAFNHITGGLAFGGPLRIPHLIPLRSAPNFFVAYQIVRNRTGSTSAALVPTEDQRSGQFSTPIYDRTTGQFFPGNMIPQSLISPQALSLLRFYPLPNFESGQYNYQVPIAGRMDQDSLQSRLSKGIGRYNQVFGNFGYQNTRNQTNNIFNFLDRTATVGYSINVSWMHRFNNRIFTTSNVTFSRQTMDVAPYFANRENVSGDAGITGNLQSPLYWGPPQLVFSSNITSLSDGNYSSNHNQTMAVGSQTYWAHSPHNFTFGGDFRRQQFNALSQQNPRGTFAFTGGVSGSDFADFLLGIPGTSSIAYGNADKYFRSSIYDAYFTDDWRVSPSLTLNAGVRWEYSSPITELYGRLVNLDITQGFASAVPVIANNPVGPLTGNRYPSSLVNPDKHGFQPRIGVAWRPISGSSLVVRAGYGVNYNTSVYTSIAFQMAQQAPLSKSFSVQNSAGNPLTLANGFIPSPLSNPTNFAIDPNFRVGYAQSWSLSIQRDLPGALVLNANYLGIKGTRGTQQFLPNTYPPGVESPCSSCLPGYTYMTSNGNSTNQKGNVQIRRRLHNGMTATVQYTYSKAIDDAALGGRGQGTAVIAQNWLDLASERGLSSFDQRHLLSFQGQYTTGVGVRGGTLLDGWRGTAFKEWTISTQITAGTGLPLSPVFFATVPNTGVTDAIRPDYTGAPLYNAPPGLFLNPAAYVAPVGHWGSAGRNTIEGPDVFTISGSAARTFRLRDRLNMDVTLNSSNPINHPTFTSWVTNIRSPQFGLPAGVNSMRTVQLTLRVRF